MNISFRSIRKIIVFAFAVLCTNASHAALISTGKVDINGAGIGTVDTVLTLQNDNASGLSSGAIARGPSGDVRSGDVKPGAPSASTYSFGELGIASAAEILLVFNADEPGAGSGNNSIRIDQLTLSIFSSSGLTLFNTSLAAPIFFAETLSGIGRADFGFVLDGTAAAAAQQYISAGNRIGLSSSLSLATGGFDTFFVTKLTGSENPIPEPGSVALLGLGLAGLLAMQRPAIGKRK